VALWYILCYFGIFCGHMVHFPRFGILYHEKSGNPDPKSHGMLDKVESVLSDAQGCQIFLGPEYQNGENYTKLPQNIPNGHKIFPMAVK
jgi:hypothetical protein